MLVYTAIIYTRTIIITRAKLVTFFSHFLFFFITFQDFIDPYHILLSIDLADQVNIAIVSISRTFRIRIVLEKELICNTLTFTFNKLGFLVLIMSVFGENYIYVCIYICNSFLECIAPLKHYIYENLGPSSESFNRFLWHWIFQYLVKIIYI